MDRWDLNGIGALLEECGRVAVEMSANPQREFKSDKSIVTAADKELERMLSMEFDRPEEGVYLIGEETVASRSHEYLGSALSGKAWIVDPIDGTALYAHGIPLWGVSIAFTEGGVVREGGIFMPETGEMILSESGTALRCSGSEPGRFKRLSQMEPPDGGFDEGGIISFSQKMAKRGSFKGANPVQALCSCVYSMASLATGRHLSYVLGAKVWDLAGSLPFLKALGFAGRLHDGADLMTMSIDSQSYDLDFDSRKAWSLRGHAIFAPSEETLAEVASRCEIPLR